MRVAVVAGSIIAGIRIAKEIERLPAVDVSIVVCNPGMKAPLRRWIREFLLALKSLEWRALAANAGRYARAGKLLILRRPLDDATSIERLKSLKFDVGLHAANVIYRESTISAFRLGILNAHIGILPRYRGRSVAEWSILQGDPVGVTVFFIDSGIDTGERIVLREFISSSGKNSVAKLKNMLFSCDARLYRQGLEILVSSESRFDSNDVSKGRRYYVMSKVFRKAANKILASP